MDAAYQEKRKMPRIKLPLPVRYRIRGSPAFENALVGDISAGGLSFTGNGFLAPATTLNLEINVYSRLIEPVGKIAWAKPLPHSNRYLMGVEFVELNLTDRNYLDDYIRIRMNRLP